MTTNKRISNLFYDESEFNKAKITYKTALKTKQHWISINHPRIKGEIKIGKWSGSTHPSTQMLRQTYAKNSLNSFVNISLENLALEEYSI